jgi:hypothetical protein
MKSDLMRELAAPARFFVGVVSRSPEQAAQTVAYLASSSELEGVTGRFFKGAKISQSNEYSRDSGGQDRLWLEAERLVGESFP